MPEGNRLLYDQLKKDNLYTKSYEEFSKQFSTPEKLYTLYTTMKSDGFYTKPIEEFKTKYWTAPKTTITIKDTRDKDMVTDTAMTDRNRMHSEVDTNTIRKIAENAKKYNIDPYTALAIGIQETGWSPDYADNPLRLSDTMVNSQEDQYYIDSDPIGFSLKKLSEKFTYAKKLGKKTDEDIIQSWNGYGKLKAGTENIKDTAYGIDISKEPLDMNKNPVYGKRVKDIRDNILKKNPEVVKIMNSVLIPSRK